MVLCQAEGRTGPGQAVAPTIFLPTCPIWHLKGLTQWPLPSGVSSGMSSDISAGFLQSLLPLSGGWQSHHCRTGMFTEGHLDRGWTVTRKAVPKTKYTYQCPRLRTQDTHFPSVASQQIHLCHPNLNLSPVPNTHVHTYTHSTAATYPSPIITTALCVWPRKPWCVCACTSSALPFQRGNDSHASYLELSTFNCTPPNTNSIQWNHYSHYTQDMLWILRSHLGIVFKTDVKYILLVQLTQINSSVFLYITSHRRQTWYIQRLHQPLNFCKQS